MTGKVINQKPFYDRLINTEVELQLGDLMQTGKVIGRPVGPEGAIEGLYNDNLMLNSLLHGVEFPDGQVKEHSANIIVENMLCRVYSDSIQVNMLEAIRAYEKDNTVVDITDKCVVTPKGRRMLRKTTKEWKLKVVWANGSELLLLLKDLKESNPVKVTEFVKARGLEKEPMFC